MLTEVAECWRPSSYSILILTVIKWNCQLYPLLIILHPCLSLLLSNDTTHTSPEHFLCVPEQLNGPYERSGKPLATWLWFSSRVTWGTILSVNLLKLTVRICPSVQAIFVLCISTFVILIPSVISLLDLCFASSLWAFLHPELTVHQCPPVCYFTPSAWNMLFPHDYLWVCCE